jgi:sugar transferase (PEP-CTERM system associated)
MLNIAGQRVPPKTLLIVLGDGILISVGLLAAAAVRAPYSGSLWAHFSTGGILARFALVVLASQLALYYNDLYNSPLVSRNSEIFVQLLQALGIACLVLGVFYYLSPELSLGRGIAALAAPTILILTVGWRFWLNRSGFLHNGANRVLMVGTGSVGISLAREIISKPELNLRVVGFLDEKGENIGKSLVNPGIIGAVSDVETITADRSIDRVVLSLAERRGCTPVRQLLHLKFAGIGVEDAHSLYEKITGRILLEHLSPSWLILSDGFGKSAFMLAIKRALDVLIALVALVLTLPLMLLVAVAIWLETGKPILFRQNRAGLGGRVFSIVKFRSMHQDAEESGPSWAVQGDQRVTRVGRLLRKFRLDELPQLFNVLRGEMSLVGPRPEQPHFCALLEEHLSLFNLRHSVRPGITGWAQIKYQYGSSIEESKTKLEYDLFYLKHLSLLLDLIILFETAKVILYGKGAK